MCMGKPSHVHKYGVSQPVADILRSEPDYSYTHDVFVANLKLGEIGHMQFEQSELEEYRSSLSPPPAYEQAPPYMPTLTHTTVVDEKTPLFTASSYYGEKGGLPLPVTTSTRGPEKLTKVSKVLLVLTLLMVLHIGYKTF